MSHRIQLFLPLFTIAFLFIFSISSCVHETPTKDCQGTQIPSNWPCETRVTACGETLVGPTFTTDTTVCLYVTACGESIVGEPVDTMSCLYITACGETIIGEPIDTIPCSSVACTPDTMYYQQDVVPVLLRNGCIGCHTAAADIKGIVLTSYDELIFSNIVEPGNPDNSELIEVVTTTSTQLRMPPSPDPPMDTNDVNILREWIFQGAQNLACDEELCYTEAVKYSGEVLSILDARCVACHTENNNPQGGIILNTYEGVAASAKDGTLLGSLLQWQGYDPMPPLNKPPLTDCEINQLKSWIVNGYEEN